MARLSTAGWLLVSGVFLASACKPDSPPAPTPPPQAAPDVGSSVTAAEPPTPTIVKEEGPMPTEATVIASAGPHQVTVGEFEKSSRISLLFGPEGLTAMPPERLAIPHIHATMTQSLLGQKLMIAESNRRQLIPTDDEIVAWLEAHPKLGRFGALVGDDAALRAALAPYGLEKQELFDVALAELVKESLTEALVSEIDDAEVWKAFELERTTRTLALVSMSNVPSSEEIDEFVANNAAKIDEYFQKNPREFRIPRRARLHVVRPAAGVKLQDATLEKAAAELGRGVQPVTVAKTLGLEHDLDVEMVRGENPKAFGSEPGAVGWEADGPRGAYAWKLQGFEPSRLPEMSRPLRREIAATMLRKETLTPRVQKRLEEAASILKKLPREELGKAFAGDDAVKFEFVTTIDHPTGFLPGYGLAEEVVDAAFDTQVGEVSQPILSRERGFVFQVVDRQIATRKEFEASLEANRKAYRDAYRPRALQMWVEHQLNEKGATVDTLPLRVKYGVLQKK